MKNQRNVTGHIVIGTICLAVMGCVTWYFVFFQSQLKVDPIKKDNTITITQKDSVETSEKSVSSASDNADTEGSRDTLSKAETSVMSTSENSCNVAFPVDENRQIDSEQDVQKSTADFTKNAEIVRILTESEELLKRADETLARHKQFMEILDTVPISQHQGKLPENVVENLLNQLVPNLVEELNTLSATEQRKLITQLRPLMKTMVGVHTQESDSVDVLLKMLHAHGFEPKY